MTTSSRKRTGPPVPPPEPLGCPGSWQPEHTGFVGDVAACPMCGRAVRLVLPPARNRDPWEGSPDARVAPH
jgi:hypothetical protein